MFILLDLYIKKTPIRVISYILITLIGVYYILKLITKKN